MTQATTSGKTAPAGSDSRKKEKMNGGSPPEWIAQAIKSGGVVAAIGLLYIAVLQPMREDFRAFKRDTAIQMGAIEGELKELNKALTGDMRDRLAIQNQRVTTLEERLRAQEKRLERVEKR